MQKWLTAVVKTFLVYLATASAIAALSLFGFRQSTPSRGTGNLKVPQLTGEVFLNTNRKPIVELGSVTLVHFWTFACGNCQANLPAYDRIFGTFAPKGLKVVGIHTPELDFEHKLDNVKSAVAKRGIKWPVLVDETGSNWTRWNVRYWPTVFLVDRKGEIRFKWEGELAWDGKDGEKQLTQTIERLLTDK